ncbi:hypothetical protein J6590_079134 [Homalodisca vitripennis]|nr:hypothetical protein J6590_079134 [Homalodisca vitripennis]
MDYLGFTLHGLNLKSKDPGYVAFRPADQVNGDVLFEIFGGIIQSNADCVKSSDTFKVEFTRVNLPTSFNKAKKKAGKDSCYEVMKRYPDFSLRTAQSTSLQRAADFSKEETKLALRVHTNRCKVMSVKGEKQVGKLSTAERGMNVTLLFFFFFNKGQKTQRLLLPSRKN